MMKRNYSRLGVRFYEPTELISFLASVAMGTGIGIAVFALGAFAMTLL